GPVGGHRAAVGVGAGVGAVRDARRRQEAPADQQGQQGAGPPAGAAYGDRAARARLGPGERDAGPVGRRGGRRGRERRHRDRRAPRRPRPRHRRRPLPGRAACGGRGQVSARAARFLRASHRAPPAPTSSTVPPRVPRERAGWAGPVCGRVPPSWPEPTVPCGAPPSCAPPPPPPAVTSRTRDGPGSFVGVQVVVMPRASMVSTPAVKVTSPLSAGVYVPLKSLIFMGVLAGIAASLAGPVTSRVPLSAPPSSMVALGLIAPLPSSTGLEETSFCQDMVMR